MTSEELTMKLAIVTLLAFATVAYGRNLDLEAVQESHTAYGYLEKIGRPLADEIRKAEEQTSRIVGGSPSRLGQFPYQVGVLITFPGGTGVCGGSLLSNNRVLSAAHCWFDGRNQASLFTLVLGSITLFTGGVRIPTNQIVLHDNWQPSLARNDIAIVRLPEPVSFTSYISPVTLPSGAQINDNFAGSAAIASGFGLTSDGGGISTSQFLSHVEVDIITNIRCTLSFPLILQPSNICISGNNGRSTCRGDSGGPLVVIRNNVPILVGVTSFGSARGCEIGSPAAFARVTSFINFINNNL